DEDLAARARRTAVVSLAQRGGVVDSDDLVWYGSQQRPIVRLHFFEALRVHAADDDRNALVRTGCRADYPRRSSGGESSPRTGERAAHRCVQHHRIFRLLPKTRFEGRLGRLACTELEPCTSEEKVARRRGRIDRDRPIRAPRCFGVPSRAKGSRSLIAE